jgi:hypothetical protein
MRAQIGDRLHIHNNHTGASDQYGRIVEIRGANGTPPYLVEFPDGHTSLVYPGPDAVIESTDAVGGHGGVGLRTRRVHTRVGW